MKRDINLRDPALLEAQVLAAVRDATEDLGIALGSESQLAGEGGLMDARSLVQLCLALEDIASDAGFDFGWSTAAFTLPNSMFRTVGTLVAGFVRQSQRAAKPR